MAASISCKLCGAIAVPKYTLKTFTVYACSACDFHAIEYLDRPPFASNDSANYIQTQLEFNREKFKQQADLCEAERGKRCNVLDIGCGGGAFLKIMRDRGHNVTGVELNPKRRAYCHSIGLDVVERPVETWNECRGFDLITLWDVIEHVNCPRTTIAAAYRQLKKGGAILLDTPSRDAAFYRFGQMTYRISGGRLPTLLRTMYNAAPFGHKQIFTDAQIANLLRSCGFNEVRVTRKFELSFPIEYYLHRLFKNQNAARALKLPAQAAIGLLRVRNKVIVVGTC